MSRRTTGKRRLLRRRRWFAPSLMLLAFFGAAALIPSIAWAQDLSTDSCTASDVQVIGNGTVVNEPCASAGTFSAVVSFMVQNSASSSRYCVTLYLVPDGTILKVPTDVTLYGPNGTSTIPGKSTISMVGTIPNFPAGTGMVCFGQAGTVSGHCAPGTCSTIAWNTSSTATCPNPSPPNGQCRHQQVCVTGYGATLACTAGCTPTCGSTATLQACANAPANRGPFSFKLTGSDGSSQTQSGVAASSSGTTCVNFNVKVTQNTIYTLTVTDNAGCTRTAMTSLVPTSIPQPTLAAGTPACDGTTTFTASPSGLADYQFTIDGGSPIDNKTSSQLTTKLAQGATHTATVTVTDSNGCSNTSTQMTVPVNAALTVSGAMTSGPDCTGKVTLTASASGGAGGFTFQWFDGTTSMGTSNPLTVTLPQDGKDHSMTAKVTDSAGCSTTSAITVHVNLPVSVSAAAGTPDCAGNVTLTATPSGGTGSYSSFQWFDGTTSIATGQSPMVTLAPGDHSITVKATDSAACSGTSASITVHVNLPVSVSAAAGTPDCAGKVTLTATPSGGTGTYTFQWFDGSTPIGTSNPLTVTLAVGATHSITVKATDSSSNACTATSAAISLPVPAAVTISASKTSGPDCAGKVTLTATPSGGISPYTFQWFDGSTPIGTSNPLTVTLALGVTHSITVKATDSSSNACSATSAAISLPVPAAVTISASKTSGPDCAGKVTLTATPGGGISPYTFQWFDGSTPIGTNNPLTVTLAPGVIHNITVKTTDSSSNACTASAAISVSVPAVVTVAGSLTSGPDCAGNVTLTATPSGGISPYTFQWFDGSTPIGTSNPLTVTLALGVTHSITVKATDSSSNACTAISAAISVPVPAAVTVSVSLASGTTPDCTGHLTFTASATGGAGPYTFTWKIDGNTVSGNTGNTLAYTPNVDCKQHVVTVTATDSNGCMSGNTATRTVTQVVTTTVS